MSDEGTEVKRRGRSRNEPEAAKKVIFLKIKKEKKITNKLFYRKLKNQHHQLQLRNEQLPQKPKPQPK